jgi:hypothetical protein
MRHCVVALDESGGTICEVDLSLDRRYKFYETTDLSIAMEVSGILTQNMLGALTTQRPMRMHPRNRRNEPSVQVAGFEVVSEEGWLTI